MKCLRDRYFLLLLALWVFVIPVRAVEFVAALDRTTAIVGEQVSLTLRIDGGSLRGTPQLPAMPGIEVAPGISSGMNSSTGPGGTVISQTFTYTLFPRQPGELVIPALQVDLEGQRLSTQPLKLRVLLTDPFSPPAEYSNRLAFVWVSLPKDELFVGETIVAEVRLYLRNGISQISEPQIPNLTGNNLLMTGYVEGPRLERTVGNIPFSAIQLFSLVTAVKSGPTSIAASDGSIVVHVTTGYDRFWGRPITKPQQVPLDLPEKVVQVLNLPAAGIPPSFTGIVGTYELALTAGPTNVVVGDPITVRVQLSGTGSPESLKSFKLPEWKGFKSYEPTSKIQTNSLGEGTNFFEQVIVPQSANVTEVPPASFTFFDPQQKQYRVLMCSAIPLRIRPGETAVLPAASPNRRSPPEPPPAAQDIGPIKQHLGTLLPVGPPLIQRPWFLAVQCAPLLVLIGAFAWRKRNDALARNPRLRRRKQVAQTIRQGIDELKRSAAARNSDAFFAIVFRLLQEQLGERIDMPASSITESVIEERLRPRNVDETTLRELQEIFQLCNLARYAPVKSSQELAALIPKVEGALQKVQEIRE